MDNTMNLRAMRRISGKTQTDVATACGVSQQSVQQWEAGRSTPTMDKLPALSTVLGVSIDALVLALTK